MASARSIHAVLGEVSERLSEANTRDLTELTDDEVLELTELTAHVVRLADAAHVRIAGRLDVTRAWSDDGARSPAAWVAWHCHLPTERARAVLRCARQLRSMPL